MQGKRRKPFSRKEPPIQPVNEVAVRQAEPSAPPSSTAPDVPCAGLVRQILRHLPDGCWGAILDRNLRHLLADGPGLIKLGLSPAQVVDKTVDEVLPPAAEQVKPHFLRAFAGDEVAFDLALGEQSLHIGVSLLEDTSYPAEAILVIVHNTTASRSLQASLLAAAQTTRTEEQEHEAFLSLVAHELRTPLTVISGQIQMLERGKLDESKRAEARRKIREQTKRLQRLIDDLLDSPRNPE